MKAMAKAVQKKPEKRTKTEKAEPKGDRAKKARLVTPAPVAPGADFGDFPRERVDPVLTPTERKHEQVDLNGEKPPRPDVETTTKESKTHEFKSQRFVLVIKGDALESIKDLDEVNEKRKKLLAKIKPKKDIEDLPKGQKVKETDDLIRAALEFETA